MFRVHNLRMLQRKKIATAGVAIGCITIVFYLFPMQSSQQAFSNKIEQYQYSSDVMEVLHRFSSLAAQKNIIVCTIEPGILLSMLSEEQQRRLRHRTDFDFPTKNRNVIAVAIQGSSAWRLLLNSFNNDLTSVGFAYFGGSHDWKNSVINSLSNTSNLNKHYFYVRQGVVIHAVIFHLKENYFWHGKLFNLPHEVAQELDETSLLFTNSESIYDRFNIVSMPLSENHQGLYVPDNIEKFLFEISTSQLVDCLPQEPKRDQFEKTSSSNYVAPPDVFAQTATSVIADLKKITVSHLAPVWLASGTLLGWYRNCGIIPYTHDMDFATWSSDWNEILAKDFHNQGEWKMIAALGQVEKDLELWLVYKWLRVDLFFMYQKDNQFWVGGHNPNEGYSFRYSFPNFNLCSGVLLGHKVLVPCRAEEVIEAEYGSDWRTPIAAWNYEESARNVIGRRYWSNEERYNFTQQMAAFH